MVEAKKSWTTLEDEDIERIERLGQRIRCDPLLPPPLEGTARIEGLSLPLVHCAFEDCNLGLCILAMSQKFNKAGNFDGKHFSR